MRHWHPLLTDALKKMKADGVKRAVVVILSVFQSRASWDQYKSDIAEAIKDAHHNLPVSFTPPLYIQRGFLTTMSERVGDCLDQIPPSDRKAACIVFTAHSIPHADPHVEQYTQQVKQVATEVARQVGHPHWKIAFQSRSGRPQDPWLEPDVNDLLRDLPTQRIHTVVVAPIGFVCDNIEVLYDLGMQARETANEIGISFLLAKTVGVAPMFIDSLAEVVMDLTSSRTTPLTVF